MTEGTPCAPRSTTMSGRRLAAWTGAWAGGAVLAIANGAVREALLLPAWGDVAARQVSTVTLILLLGAYVWWLCRHWPLPSYAAAVRVGAVWVLLTVGFEFGLGHYVEGKSWATLLGDYDVAAGRIWLLVPVWTLVAPAAVTWLRRRRGIGERSAAAAETTPLSEPAVLRRLP